MAIKCPTCGKPHITLQISYLCEDDHHWKEIVDVNEPKKLKILMPFGKYRGEPVEDIPLSYITWILENIKLTSPSLEAELKSQQILKTGKGVIRNTKIQLP